MNKKLVGFGLIFFALILITIGILFFDKKEIDKHADIIKVSSPLPNTIINSPLLIEGVARGNWYFEASFPVHLIDGNGKELMATPAQAQGEWMTSEFVPFKATLNFVKPTTSTGTLVFKKDNASGLPEFDDSISIPIKFAQ